MLTAIFLTKFVNILHSFRFTGTIKGEQFSLAKHEKLILVVIRRCISTIHIKFANRSADEYRQLEHIKSNFGNDSIKK